MGGAPEPISWCATLLIEGDSVYPAKLDDVLAPGKTRKDFIAACRAAAEGFGPEACSSPDLSFALLAEGTILCTGFHPSPRMDSDTSSSVMHPDFARELGW
jgi:hypothetical protein